MAIRYVLTTTSADQAGLLAAVTGAIAAVGCSIEDGEVHRDVDAGITVQRFLFDGESTQDLETSLAGIAPEFGLEWELTDLAVPAKLGIAVSREGHCLLDLLARAALGEIRGDVAVVVGNHDILAPHAERFGVPFVLLPSDVDREDRDAAMTAAFQSAGCDLVVLARYMQIVTDSFCDTWAGKAINIHHSFLPAFIGARPYHQAWERGVKMIGATAHYVTSDLDQGPIISQDTVQVTHRDGIDDLRRLGADVERLVLGRAVRAHLDRRVVRYGSNRTAVFD